MTIYVEEIQRNPYEGLGKPEALKFDMSGTYSRRVDREYRLVYKIEKGEIIILQCRYHC